MTDKAGSLLGLCRRAGRLAMGHDACSAAIYTGIAKLCLLTADASDRLKDEFRLATQKDNRAVPLRVLDCTMQDIKAAAGRPAGVLTVNDEGFAAALLAQLEDN